MAPRQSAKARRRPRKPRAAGSSEAALHDKPLPDLEIADAPAAGGARGSDVSDDAESAPEMAAAVSNGVDEGADADAEEEAGLPTRSEAGPKIVTKRVWKARRAASASPSGGADPSPIVPSVSHEQGESSGGCEPSPVSSEVVVGVELREVEEQEQKGKGKEIADEDDEVEEEESVVRRLERLRAVGDEPELPEEQLQANDQLQETEILVLESIYGDDVVIFDKLEGLRLFQIRVHYDVTDGINISTKLGTHAGMSNIGVNADADKSNEFTYTFNVQYLPPIVLTCLLPPSYPSHHPPYFTIAAAWIDKPKISSLCQMLDTIWTEQSGQEVVFQWVQWLQSTSLSFLGFDEDIVLGPCDTSGGADNRAASQSIPPEIIIPRMMNYNHDKCHQAFLNELHLCVICYTEFAGTDFIKLACGHFFCSKCVQTYLKIHVKEGSVLKLLCPDAKCDGLIPPDVLKRLLEEEEFKRWEDLTLQRTLDSMKDVVYCPRCETACLEDDENHAQCSKCYYSFCTICYDRRHVGEKCLSPEEKLRFLKERQNAGSLTRSEQRKVIDRINEVLSIKEALKDAKQCPSCKMAISRIEGCNKMICSNCNAFFCYSCNKQIDGYDHFRDGSCVLFPGEEVARWEMRVNQRQIVAQVQAELFRDFLHVCPSCHQPNAKVGNNNHIFCWACQNHFCALCKKTVRKSSQHYGPKGCKQHTADP